MARRKIDIIDRVADGDNKFILKNLSDNTTIRVQLEPDPDKLTVEGTPVNKKLMQPWEDIFAALTYGSDSKTQLRVLNSGRVILMTNKGFYSETETYSLYDYVTTEEGIGYRATADNTIGKYPAEDSNFWCPFVW